MIEAALDAGERERIAVEAYLYLYPLVLMETTRRVSTNWRAGVRSGVGPMGTLVNARSFPPATFRTIVRPNFDTLYSTAWLDLTIEPYVISLPALRDRFFMLPIYDMWTDVVASPGTRTHGGEPLTVALCAPDWRGTLPDDVSRIDATTPVVWVLGRTETRGVGDFGAVHALQDQMRLAPLSSWPNAANVTGERDDRIDMRTAPMRQVDAMSTHEFFATAARLARRHPPHATDWSMVARMARVGFVVGQDFDLAGQPDVVVEAFEAAPDRARRTIAERAHTIAPQVHGWSTMDDLGVYGNAYAKRALVAQRGLGANPVEESLYPNLLFDAGGDPLHGSHRYVLRFARQEIPPVDAFWSLTVYDRHGFPVANEIDRYALGDRDDLVFGHDDSLEILLAHERPTDEWMPNWLPVPADGFAVTLRLYLPRDAALFGQWHPPAAQRID